MTTIESYRQAAASEIASLLARLEGLSDDEQDFAVARFGDRLSARHPDEVEALKEAALDALRELPGLPVRLAEASEELPPASALRRIFAALAYAVDHPRPRAPEVEAALEPGPARETALPDWEPDDAA